MSKTKIRNYALIIETSPEELVNSVTRACGDGFYPLGGVSVMREVKSPAMPLGGAKYVQAMIRMWQPEDHPLAINGR
jgi:hypothetical protein